MGHTVSLFAILKSFRGHFYAKKRELKSKSCTFRKYIIIYNNIWLFGLVVMWKNEHAKMDVITTVCSYYNNSINIGPHVM
jgi:hypothetical protein